MKAVILAAGKGKRMKDLTTNTPKPLLTYEGKNLMQHKLEVLPDEITEIVVVVGYIGDLIVETLGDNFNGKPIQYVEQDELLGTAHALWQCQDILKDENFIVLMGDDLYSKGDLEKLIDGDDWKILAFESDDQKGVGKIVLDINNNFREILEDPNGEIPYTLIYTGACYLTPEIFTEEMVPLGNGEYGLPQTISKFVDRKEIKVIEAKDWIRITAPEDLK